MNPEITPAPTADEAAAIAVAVASFLAETTAPAAEPAAGPAGGWRPSRWATVPLPGQLFSASRRVAPWRRES